MVLPWRCHAHRSNLKCLSKKIPGSPVGLMHIDLYVWHFRRERFAKKYLDDHLLPALWQNTCLQPVALLAVTPLNSKLITCVCTTIPCSLFALKTIMLWKAWRKFVRHILMGGRVHQGGGAISPGSYARALGRRAVIFPVFPRSLHLDGKQQTGQ